MLGKAFDKIDLYKQTLNASWLRQQVIANNIANVNTPGYKRQTIEFENTLKEYLELSEGISVETTNEKHIGNFTVNDLSPRIETIGHTSMREDNNNVNIDVEMAEQAKNSLKYNAVTEQLNSQYRRLRMAITGR